MSTTPRGTCDHPNIGRMRPGLSAMSVLSRVSRAGICGAQSTRIRPPAARRETADVTGARPARGLWVVVLGRCRPASRDPVDVDMRDPTEHLVTRAYSLFLAWFLFRGSRVYSSVTSSVCCVCIYGLGRTPSVLSVVSRVELSFDADRCLTMYKSSFRLSRPWSRPLS